MSRRVLSPAPPRPDLDALLRAMQPPTEAQLRAQRESWVRGEMALGLDRDEAIWREANMPKEIP